MQVREVMSTNFKLVPPQATIQEAARLMRDGDFGFMPVGDEDGLVGTLTDRDIVVCAVADGLDTETPVGDLVKGDVVTVREDADVEAAAQLMRDRQIRRLAVVGADERLVGVLSVGDIARENSDRQLTGAIEEDVARGPGNSQNAA
jgi:CBS domain-containing protein